MTTPKKVEVTKPVDDVEARAMFAGDAAGPVSLGQYWQQYTNKLRAGEMDDKEIEVSLVDAASPR